MNTVLVAYATKRGSTREVAADVARVIRQSGAEVEISPARNVKTLDRYQAVVLGGALYMGRWHKDARKMLKRHRAELASLPLAVFALGPKEITPEAIEKAGAELARALAEVPEAHPFSTAIFGGVIDPKRLHFPFSRMQAGDARDWNAIQDWASEVVRGFSTRSTP
jgi:menaquinone-dependent protoporphyrinogen oxidase